VLPPEGLYNSCEIDTALSTCESEDAEMASDGFSIELNYIGWLAHKTGANSLPAWLAYDQTIGMQQIISVKAALNDANPLTGTSLVTGSLPSDCGATNNEQIISCIASVVDSSPAFFGWYIYDEPGCPNQSIGYCTGSLAGKNYENVDALASYIASIDPNHPVMGVQTSGGPPCSAGGYSCAAGQTQVNNLFSCNGNSPCNGVYPWITTPVSSYTGWDYYPITGGPGTQAYGESTSDIGNIPALLKNTIAANYPSEKTVFVGQAFSWYEEEGAGCSSVSVCPYPTTAQMQNMRDQALYYSKQAGSPVSMILWYYWPDVVCDGPQVYSGCSAAANRAALKAAAFAPFPTTPPPALSAVRATANRRR
jgi:hypothetical protein